MIELKKSELENVLIIISVYNKENGLLIGGLLSEDITLGTKRALQKIHKKVHVLYQELLEDYKELKEKVSEEELQKETEELLNEIVKIDIEKIKFSFLENVSTKSNYNFEIIDKFSE